MNIHAAMQPRASPSRTGTCLNGYVEADEQGGGSMDVTDGGLGSMLLGAVKPSRGYHQSKLYNEKSVSRSR